MCLGVAYFVFDSAFYHMVGGSLLDTAIRIEVMALFYFLIFVRLCFCGLTGFNNIWCMHQSMQMTDYSLGKT
jgi:hypothetical protein